MDPITTIQLVSSAIKLYGVFCDEFIDKEVGQATIIVNERIYDNKALESVVNSALLRFERIIGQNTEFIIDALNKQGIKDVVFEIQAHVKSLKTLLDIKSQGGEQANLTLQLVLTSLNPLQVSIEKAKLKLKDCNEESLWRYCYITGTTSLLSGYAYLGISMPNIKNELDDEILKIKKEILSDVTNKYYSLKRVFPWEKVQSYLQEDNIEALKQLYDPINNQLNTMQQESKLEKILCQPVSELKYDIKCIYNREELEYLLKKEREGKYRFTVIELIERQLERSR